jgi:hypothetical protein
MTVTSVGEVSTDSDAVCVSLKRLNCEVEVSPFASTVGHGTPAGIEDPQIQISKSNASAELGISYAIYLHLVEIGQINNEATILASSRERGVRMTSTASLNFETIFVCTADAVSNILLVGWQDDNGRCVVETEVKRKLEAWEFWIACDIRFYHFSLEARQGFVLAAMSEHDVQDSQRVWFTPTLLSTQPTPRLWPPWTLSSLDTF